MYVYLSMCTYMYAYLYLIYICKTIYDYVFALFMYSYHGILIYVYVPIYTYLCMPTYVCVPIYVHLSMCFPIYMFTYLCIYLSVSSMYNCIYVYAYEKLFQLGENLCIYKYRIYDKSWELPKYCLYHGSYPNTACIQ